MTTTQALSFEEAAQLLRENGYTVKLHGARFLVTHAEHGTKVFTKPELIAYAERWYGDGAAGNGAPHTTDLDTIGGPQSLPPGSMVAQLDGAMPLMDLMMALERHADGLPDPLPLDLLIAQPAGLRERLSVPIGVIVPGRYQPRTRFDETKLAELADSIREHGILNPLIVFANERGNLELIAGERRLRAAYAAELTFVPVEIRAYTLRHIAEISALDNLQRDDLTPIEEGVAYERLIKDLGLSEAELARRLGKNRGYIQQRRAIASAAPEVIQALDEGAITFSQARAIAQVAPGQAAAQKQALTKLRDLAKQGKRTTETEARAAAEKVVLSKAKKDLEALGWTVSEPYGGYFVWAATEKPRQWTGMEILEAVATKRRPSDTRPAEKDGSVVAELLATLKLRYRINQEYTPWIGLSREWELPTFYAADELADLVAEISAGLSAMQERVKAAGWTLTVDASGMYSQARFIFQSKEGAQHSVWGYAEAEKAIAGIEAGKVSAKPAPAYTPPKQKCEECKQNVTEYRHIEGRRLCQACTKQAERAIAERKQRSAREVHGLMEAWLIGAPIEALRLLAALMTHAPYDAGQAKAYAEKLRSATAADLAATVLKEAIDRADDYRAAPLYDAVPALKVHRILTEWDDIEAQAYVSQAERAAALLDADGYASVAAFVRQTREALLPGSSSDDPPPPQSVGTDDGTPAAAWPALRPIQDALDDLETQLGAAQPFDAQQLADWRQLLDDLRGDLDELSGDTDLVDDSAWEETSMRIGELARQVKALQEVEVGA